MTMNRDWVILWWKSVGLPLVVEESNDLTKDTQRFPYVATLRNMTKEVAEQVAQRLTSER